MNKAFTLRRFLISCAILISGRVILAPPSVSAQQDMSSYKRITELSAEVKKLGPAKTIAAKRELADLQMQLGWFYNDTTQFSNAEKSYRSALSLREETKDSPELIAESRLELGNSYRALGIFSKAEPLLLSAFSAAKPSSPEKRVALNRLASLYNNWGNFRKAEKYQREALSLQALNDKEGYWEGIDEMLLADILRQQGKYKEAEPYLVNANKILKKPWPDRDYAAAMNNLGALYYWQGQYSKAEPLLKSGLLMREKVCGPTHIDVANSLGDLAALDYARGNYSSAQARLERALKIREKQMGTNHPLTASTMSNLGNVYATTHQTPKAKALVSKAVAIKEQTLGPKSPDLAQGLDDLAELCIDTKEFAKAETLATRAKSIREAGLGKDNPNYAASLRTLARLDYEKGNFSKALEEAQQAQSIFSKTLSAQHPETKQTEALLKAIRRKQSGARTGQ